VKSPGNSTLSQLSKCEIKFNFFPASLRDIELPEYCKNERRVIKKGCTISEHPLLEVNHECNPMVAVDVNGEVHF
jgi:hypothetical protein